MALRSSHTDSLWIPAAMLDSLDGYALTLLTVGCLTEITRCCTYGWKRR